MTLIPFESQRHFVSTLPFVDFHRPSSVFAASLSLLMTGAITLVVVVESRKAFSSVLRRVLGGGVGAPGLVVAVYLQWLVCSLLLESSPMFRVVLPIFALLIAGFAVYWARHSLATKTDEQ